MWVLERQETRTVTADAEVVGHNAATRLSARQPSGTSVSGTVLGRDTAGVRADDGKQRVRAVALAAALLAVAGGAAWYGHYWWTVGRFIKSTDDAYVGGDVTVIAPKVSGLITQVAVIDNQAVHVGELLVKIDDGDYRAVAAKALAAIDAQRANLMNLDATRQLQVATVAQAEADIAAADAEITVTRDDQSRYHTLSLTAAESVQMSGKDSSPSGSCVARIEKSRLS